MNLQNKTEFKKFVKSKLSKKVDCAIYLLRNTHNSNYSIILECGAGIQHVIRICKEIDTALSRFKIYYCRWLTDCEDETYIHYRQTVFSSIACNKELKNKDKYKQTCYNSGITCNRCKKEMEKSGDVWIDHSGNNNHAFKMEKMKQYYFHSEKQKLTIDLINAVKGRSSDVREVMVDGEYKGYTELNEKGTSNFTDAVLLLESDGYATMRIDGVIQ